MTRDKALTKNRWRLACAAVCAAVFVSCVRAAQARSVVVQSDIFSRAEDFSREPQAGQNEKPVVIETEIPVSAIRKNSGLPVTAGTDGPVPAAPHKVLSADEILRVSDSLRRAIEQSRRLKDAKRRADDELMFLRRQKNQAEAQIASMEDRLKEYHQRLEESDRVKVEYDRVMADLQSAFETRIQNLLADIERMQEEIGKTDAAVLPAETAAAPESEADQSGGEVSSESASVSDPAPGADGVSQEAAVIRPAFSILEAQKKGLDVMDLLEYLDEARRQMKGDEAEIFYNMGRLFFYQGKYVEAASYYRKALEIAPAVANAHFNLAYISGEFLKDYETALEHYHRYLHLNPKAGDERLVREKILELRLQMSAQASPTRENELRTDKKQRGHAW